MISLVWFRQDLRLQDNPALNAAIKQGNPCILLYVWDEKVYGDFLPGQGQCWWLQESLISLNNTLALHNHSLIVRSGDALKIIQDLVQQHKVTHIFWNRLYEPFFIKRDTEIKKKLIQMGVVVQSFNGSMLYEPWEITNKQGSFYKVFTSYWKTVSALGISRDPYSAHISALKYLDGVTSESLKDFCSSDKKSVRFDKKKTITWQPGERGAKDLLEKFLKNGVATYSTDRDIPSVEGTSLLSPHLHFGEISPQQVWHALVKKEIRGFIAEPFLRQLGWRDFCISILYHRPDIITQPFLSEFSNFAWDNNKDFLHAWQQGKTGYPIVDAGMRQLLQTGWMHNRVRMIVASFLTKDLLLSWLDGAAWFWENLLDADVANNTCGWQWVAGCGTDAQPYFRIFNPVMQSKKFDLDGRYLRTWLPELKLLNSKHIHEPWKVSPQELKKAHVVLGTTYPYPIVDHGKQRIVALKTYTALKKPLVDNQDYGE